MQSRPIDMKIQEILTLPFVQSYCSFVKVSVMFFKRSIKFAPIKRNRFFYIILFVLICFNYSIFIAIVNDQYENNKLININFCI